MLKQILVKYILVKHISQLTHPRTVSGCVCMDAHDMKPVLPDDIIEEVRAKRSAYMETEENKG